MESLEKKLKICVVDDDPEVFRAVSENLPEYEVVFFDTANDLGELSVSRDARLVLLDHQIGPRHEEGYMLIPEIRKHNPTAEIVSFTTASAYPEEAYEALGVNTMIRKCLKDEYTFQEIREEMRERLRMQKDISGVDIEQIRFAQSSEGKIHALFERYEATMDKYRKKLESNDKDGFDDEQTNTDFRAVSAYRAGVELGCITHDLKYALESASPEVIKANISKIVEIYCTPHQLRQEPAVKKHNKPEIAENKIRVVHAEPACARLSRVFNVDATDFYKKPYEEAIKLFEG